MPVLTHLFLIETSFSFCWIFLMFFFFFLPAKPKPQFCFRKVTGFAMSLVLTQAVRGKSPRAELVGGGIQCDCHPLLDAPGLGAELLLPSTRAVPWPAFPTPGNASVCPASPLCTTGLCKWWFADWNSPKVFKMRKNQMFLLSVVLCNNLDFNTK